MLVESPEALNIIKEGHIRSIISLLDKHGRNHKVCSQFLSCGTTHYTYKWGYYQNQTKEDKLIISEVTTTAISASFSSLWYTSTILTYDFSSEQIRIFSLD